MNKYSERPWIFARDEYFSRFYITLGWQQTWERACIIHVKREEKITSNVLCLLLLWEFSVERCADLQPEPTNVKRTQRGKTDRKSDHLGISSHLSASQCRLLPLVWPWAGRPGRWSSLGAAFPSQRRTALLRWPEWQGSGSMPGMGSWKRRNGKTGCEGHVVLLLNHTSSKCKRYEANKNKHTLMTKQNCQLFLMVLSFGCSKKRKRLQSVCHVITL